MRKEKLVYHGSNAVVQEPRILVNGYYKDFGYGFYCNVRKEKLVYHGSNAVVQEPRILVNGYYKDFGYGFYCASLIKQAKRWALTRRGESIVNCYTYVQKKRP